MSYFFSPKYLIKFPVHKSNYLIHFKYIQIHEKKETQPGMFHVILSCGFRRYAEDKN